MKRTSFYVFFVRLFNEGLCYFQQQQQQQKQRKRYNKLAALRDATKFALQTS